MSTMLNYATMAVLFLFISLADARAAVVRRELSAQDRADIQHAEQALSATTSLEAHFAQAATNGERSSGMIYLRRPGRLRLQYDPPSHLLMVVNSSFLIVFDAGLGSPSYIPLDSTPVGVLVHDKVELDKGALVVTRVIHHNDQVAITVTQVDSPSDGTMTMVFAEPDFRLQQWRVVDAQGIETVVSLFNQKTDVPLKDALFEFVDPSFNKKIH